MPEKYPKIPPTRPAISNDPVPKIDPVSCDAATIDPALAAQIAPLSPPPDDGGKNNDDQLIDDRYQLDEQLGEGGMGTVYRAKHALMDKTVAVKIIHPALAHSEAIAKRFEREAKSASRLTDPHCINVTDFGRAKDGKLFLVMEFLQGETLAERLRKTCPLPIPKAIQITRHILKALDHAHQAGVVHRDLKPDNVMLVTHGDETDYAKVFDFGIAKLASAEEGDENITQAGLVLGTPSYLSPEQGTGKQTDHRADLYAVGVMLFEMIAGSRPFTGSTAMNIVLSHVSSPVPSLPGSCQAPWALEKIIKKSLAKKPEDRFSSAAQFIAALDKIDLSSAKTRSRPFALWSLLYPLRNFAAQVISRRLNRIPTTIRKRLEQLEVSSLAAIPEPIKGRIAEIAPSKRPWLLIGAMILILAIASVTAASLWMEDKSSSGFSDVAGIMETSEVDDENVRQILESAHTQLRTGDAKKASASARRALRLMPNNALAHLLLGHSLYLRGDRLGATKSYARSLRLDRSLSSDQLLGEHLKEALAYPGPRQNAAITLAEFSGEKGIEILASRANSTRASGEERAVARQALIVTDNEEKIDWVASLSADFHEYNSCGKRREIIAQIEETGDPSFLPLLKKELRRSTTSRSRSKSESDPGNPFKRLGAKFRKEKQQHCTIEKELRRAYRAITEKNADTP